MSQTPAFEGFRPFAERLVTDGLEPAPERPRAAFAAAVREESAFWARKVRELDLKLE
jgi:hypothetical protein